MIKKWIEAARPRTLPTSVSPVIAASAYAWYLDTFNGYTGHLFALYLHYWHKSPQISATTISTIKKVVIEPTESVRAEP